AYPDTLVGTDSHTTMVNGLGVLGWGVGGIEAEAAMLGQPVSMLIPEVVGFRLDGELKEGITATDLVLTVTQMLRQKGVVGRFVEFYGPGLDSMTVADRATIANMAPEYGATCGFFPIDQRTIDYLELTGRDADRIALVKGYAQVQGLWRDVSAPEPVFTDTLELDMSTIEPSLAGPKRPQDRVLLSQLDDEFNADLEKVYGKHDDPRVPVEGTECDLGNGDVVIAAITSCTNTSNPSVLVGAGLLARKARAKGLTSKPWVKTSLAPGSQVVTDYLNEGEPVYLKDIWPSNEEIRALIDQHVHSKMFRTRYADVYHGDERWRAIQVTGGATYSWPPESTYIQNPPYFTGMTMTPTPPGDVVDARALAVFGDSITTDHISPAGAIKPDSPAGRYLLEHGVSRAEFNSYGARRGNHEVMMRGTFANIRIRNRMLDNVEGGFTRYAPTGETMPIYDAAMAYKHDGTPLVVLAGKEYGTGSSRD